MKPRACLAPLAPILLIALLSTARAEPLVLRSTRIFTGEEFISGAVIVTEAGVISAGVEPKTLPAGARIVELGHRPITPGLIDLDTRLGLVADPAGPNRGVWRSAGDALGSGESLRKAARDEGLTAAVVSPGDKTLIGGWAAAIRSGEDGPVLLADAVAFKISIGPGLSNTRGPTSIAGAAMELREAFRHELGILRDASVFWVACRDDIDVRLALALDAPTRLVVRGAPVRPSTASRLFAAGASVVIGPLEMDDGIKALRSAATLRSAGVRIAFSSGDAGADALRRTATLAVREGLSEIDALRALTSDAAAIAETASLGGRLSGGRDLVVWSGSPTDLASRPLLVVVDGTVVRDDLDDLASLPPAPAVPAPKKARATAVAATRLVSPVVLLRAGLVIPISGSPLTNGQVLIRRGKIAGVGHDLDLGPEGLSPTGIEFIDLGDRVLMPGFVDAASGIAGAANEHSDEITPDWRVLDQIDVMNPAFEAALARGVTTVYVGPGTANIVGGRGAVLRTAGLHRVWIGAADLAMTMGRDAVSGNRGIFRHRAPQSFRDRRPLSRMSVNRTLRYLFGSITDGARLVRDPHVAAFARALRDGTRIRLLARTTQDLRTALRIAAEFDVRFDIEDAIAAADVAPELAKAGFRVVLGTPPHPSQQGRAAEGANVCLAVAGALEAAGVDFAFGSRSGGSRVDVRTAAILAHRHGLSREAALRAITRGGASLSGVAGKVGALAPGLHADLVVLSGDPLDPATRVEMVFVEGRVVLDAREKKDAKGDER